MSKIDELTKLIVKLIDERLKKKPKSYDVKAEVLRIEDGKAYVHIPNGVTETPVDMTIDANVGDTVQVRVGGHRAWLTGNSSRPPTDDAEALVAKAVAKIADKNAATAKDAAEEALEEAGAGITIDTLHYLATNLSSGVTINTPGWTTTAQAITTSKPYLWTYHTYIKASGSTVDTEPVITGVYGSTGTDGAKWYTGTGITGTSTTATIFPSSGVSSAVVGDMYLNTSTSNTYRCTTAGAPSVAKWVYVNNIQGEEGPEGPQGPTGPAGPGVTYITLQNGDDLNNCITKGNVYVTASTAVCTSLLNAPTGKPDGELQLEVQWLGSDNYLVQRLTCKNGAVRKVYLRTYSSGTFGDWTEEGVPYGTSSTGASTAAKTATISNWDRGSNQYVAIKFTNENTASSPTLNINSTGAAQIMTNGSNSAYWEAGSVVNFYWDGTYYQVANTPVYASTVTVGNPSGDNVFIGNSAVDIRNGSNTLARFGTDIQIGNENTTDNIMNLSSSGLRVYMSSGGDESLDYFQIKPQTHSTTVGHIYTPILGTNCKAEINLSPDPDNGEQILLNTRNGTSQAHYFLINYDTGCYTNTNLEVGGNVDISGTYRKNGVEIPYITDKGTKTGGWYYEKWSTGKIEAWGTSIATGTATVTRVSSMLYRAYNINIAIPSGIFDSTPTAAIVTPNYGSAQVAIVSAMASCSSKTALKVQIWKNGNSSDSVNLNFHVVYYPSTY